MQPLISASTIASIHYFTLKYGGASLNYQDAKLVSLSDKYSYSICSFLDKVSAIIYKYPGL